MASLLFNSFKSDIMKGNIDLDTDTIKVALVTSSYTPDIDAHEFFDDITNEVSGSGYSAGGMALSNKSVSIDDTDDEGVFDADDPVWTSATITARGAILYKDTGDPSTSPLIGYLDFGSDKTSTAGDFLLIVDSEGILNLN